tara:strand:- start:22 stop:195 length:174 start_codon:yes stop_codon:yes gene_type:complete
VKLPDWIQELYLKEMVYKSIKGEKTHDKHGTNAKETKETTEGNRRFPDELQARKSTN